MYSGYRMFPSANVLYRMFPSANELQPPLVLKPILTFPKGRDKLLCQWFQPIISAPSRSPPLGRCWLLRYCQGLVDKGYSCYWQGLVDKGYSCYWQATNNQLATDNNQTGNGICPSPTGEVRWGLIAESGSYISWQITLSMISANHFSPLSVSPEGEMLVTLVLSKPCEYRLPLLLISYWLSDNQTTDGICPSPSGEVRWGLMSIAGVNSPFPWGRLGWVALGEG